MPYIRMANVDRVAGLEKGKVAGIMLLGTAS